MKFFGPLDLKPEYCLYFYYLSVVLFVTFSFSTLGVLGHLITHRKNIRWPIVLNMISLSISSVIAYFSNRVLYTMCLSAVHKKESSSSSSLHFPMY